MRILTRDVTFEITHDEAKAWYKLFGNLDKYEAIKIIGKDDYSILFAAYQELYNEFR